MLSPASSILCDSTYYKQYPSDSSYVPETGVMSNFISSLGRDFVISEADTVFVTAKMLNCVLLDKAFTGCRSLDGLKNEIRKCIGDVPGLITLHIRNRDQGCSLKMSIRYRSGNIFTAIA